MSLAPLLLCVQLGGLLERDASAPVLTALCLDEGRLLVADHAGLSQVTAGELRRLPLELPGRVLAVLPLPADDGPVRWLIAGGVPGERGWIASLDDEGALLRRRSLGDEGIEALARGTEARGASVVLSAGADGGVRRHSLPELEPGAELHRHQGPVRALLGLGSWVVSAGRDHELVAVDLVQGRRWRAREHTAPIAALCRGPAEGELAEAGWRLYSGADDGRVRVHDAEGGLRRSYRALGAAVWALAAGPEAVFAGIADGRVFRLGARADEVEELARPEETLSCLLWLPAGSALAPERPDGGLLVGWRRLQLLEGRRGG